MDKLVLYTLPNYINITLIILLVVIVTSFITFIFATITEKENLSMVTHATLIISLTLSVVILVSASITSRIIILAMLSIVNRLKLFWKNLEMN